MACEHKEIIGCELTAVSVCCGCADIRALSQAYPTYVDGSGMRMEGTRWQKYCWRCRDHWRAEEQLESSMRISPNDQTWSFPSQPTSQTTLSPFAGTQRRNGRQRRFLAWNALQNPEDTVSSSGYEARQEFPEDRRPLERRVNNQADHTSTSPDGQHTYSPAERPRRERQNPFGTREEWEAPDYQSPVAGLFTRAWSRYRDAEDSRRQGEADVQEQLQNLHLEPGSSQQQLPVGASSHERRRPGPARSTDIDDLVYLSTGTLPDELRRVHGIAEDLRDSMIAAASSSHSHNHSHPDPTARPFFPSARLSDRLYFDLSPQPYQRSPSPPRENPIDTQAARPPPQQPEDMTVSIACKICCEQKTDTLLLPCYHVAMCRWCVAIMRTDAVREGRRGAPRVRGEGWACPMCRKGVEGTKRVFLG